MVVAGVWSYSSDTPQGTVTGTIKINDEEGSLVGKISNSFSGKETDIQDAELDGSQLSFSFLIDAGGQSIPVDVSVTVEGEVFEGTMTAGNFGSFPMEGEKSPE